MRKTSLPLPMVYSEYDVERPPFFWFCVLMWVGWGLSRDVSRVDPRFCGVLLTGVSFVRLRGTRWCGPDVAWLLRDDLQRWRWKCLPTKSSAWRRLEMRWAPNPIHAIWYVVFVVVLCFVLRSSQKPIELWFFLCFL